MLLTLGGCGAVTEGQKARFSNHRVEQSKAQYEAATDNLGRCVAAKLVAIAYTDAQAEVDARVWRAREAADCQAAYAELGSAAEP
jgi:uncharacterized protein YgiB involved in biofilm formation